MSYTYAVRIHEDEYKHRRRHLSAMRKSSSSRRETQTREGRMRAASSMTVCREISFLLYRTYAGASRYRGEHPIYTYRGIRRTIVVFDIFAPVGCSVSRESNPRHGLLDIFLHRRAPFTAVGALPPHPPPPPWDHEPSPRPSIARYAISCPRHYPTFWVRTNYDRNRRF